MRVDGGVRSRRSETRRCGSGRAATGGGSSWPSTQMNQGSHCLRRSNHLQFTSPYTFLPNKMFGPTTVKRLCFYTGS